MVRRAKAFAVAFLAVVAVCVPFAHASAPNGVGLFKDHVSTCTGGPFAAYPDGFYHGTVILSDGNSFWVDGWHLSIQKAIITDSSGEYPYTFGQKTGKASSLVRCEGDFPGYHVVSYSVVVP